MATSNTNISKPDGSSYTSNLSSDEGCGPLKYLPLTGLIEEFSDLYDSFQDALETNAQAFLKAIVLEPGLKVVENEFDCTVLGDVLEVELGTVVFSDYNVYVPSNGLSKVRISLPDPEDYSDGDLLYVIVNYDNFDDHPYPVVPVDGATISADVVRRNSLNITIEDSKLSTDMVPAQLELSGGAWTVNDWRHLYMLKLVPGGRKVPPTTEPIWGDAPANVTATTMTLSDYRQPSVDVNTGVGAINRESPYTTTGLRPIIAVSWDAPSAEEISFYGGVAYYKVILVPVYATGYNGSTPSSPAPYPARALEAYVFHDSDDGESRIGTSIPATPGMLYKVLVYRVNDNLEQITAEPNDDIYCIAGLPEQDCFNCSLSGTIPATVTPIGDPNTLCVHFNPNIVDTDVHFCQIFIKEYETWPTSTPTNSDLQYTRYLYYEGPVKDVFYRVGDNSAGIAIYPRLVLSKGNLLRQQPSNTAPIMYRVLSQEFEAETLPPFEIPFIVSATNLTVNPGGPGAGAAAYQTIFEQSMPKEIYISRMMATTPHGVDNTLGAKATNEGLWYPETYAAGTPSFVGPYGYVRISIDGTEEALVKYDSTGRCEKEFYVPLHIPAGSTLKIEVGDLVAVTCPFFMNVILYTFGSWRERANAGLGP